jgi:hypothetical protein
MRGAGRGPAALFVLEFDQAAADFWPPRRAVRLPDGTARQAAKHTRILTQMHAEHADGPGASAAVHGTYRSTA